MERAGLTKVPRYAQESTGYKAIVQHTSEFERIKNLPRRQFNSDAQQLLTNELKKPNGRMMLWPIQAAALTDIVLYRGAFLPIGVGGGKSLISLLAPVVLEAKRPILFVPAALRDQTLQYVIPAMSKHWRLHPRLRVIGYSELSLAKNVNMLEKLQPDLIVLDECHFAKNKSVGRTKRLVRYFNEHPTIMYVAMSGTIASRSLKDFAHICEWCLKQNTPLPLNWNELTLWANAIDDEESEVDPGVLREFCNFDENIRKGFRRRLVETPGVVATAENELGTSLLIKDFGEINLPASVWKAIDRMRSTWETPNGDIIINAPDLWRHMRELALGFWYRWDPTPPKDWMDARRDWKKFVRETLKHNRRNLDTELQVWNECEHNDPNEIFLKWKEIKNTFKPNTVAEWLTEIVLDKIVDWMMDGGIVWCEHVALGQKFGEFYYGGGDNKILTTNHKAIVASVSAHKEGKNLERYSRCLIISPSPSGQTWEQILGRVHRYGQLADEVTCDVFLHIQELKDSFEQARINARYLEDTYGNRQKLNYADIIT